MSKIIGVEHISLAIRYPRAIGRNALLGVHGTGPTTSAVVVRTEDGASGWGLTAQGCGDPSALLDRNLDQVFDPSRGVTSPEALWADFALHDLAGLIGGTSVHAMLRDNGHSSTDPMTSVPVYDGSIYFDDLDADGEPMAIDPILSNVQAGWDQGHRAFKIKVGRGFSWMAEEAGFARDVAVVHAVRDAFPSARLLVDGNNGFTVDAALRFLEATAEAEIFWFEEPFDEHRNGLQRLRDWRDRHGSLTLIADGEYHPDLSQVLHLAKEGLIDVLLMDIAALGLTRWRSLTQELRGSGIRFSPHTWGVPLKTFYTAQMALGVDDVITVEGVPGDIVGVDTTSYQLRNGCLIVDDQAGFGIPIPQVLSTKHHQLAVE